MTVEDGELSPRTRARKAGILVLVLTEERAEVDPGLRSRLLPRRRLVPLCELDRQFAARIPPAKLPFAHRWLLVPVCVVPRGRWFVDRETELGCGLVILDGTLTRDSLVDKRWSTEILGPEDVLRPWQELEPPTNVATASRWRALEPVRLAVLDRRFAAAAAEWPGLMDELVARGVRRSRLLAALLAVAQIRRLDDRLILVLQILADRWGCVRADGVEVRVRLTHETLARLIGARRPSVSATVARLERRGLLARDGQRFILPLALLTG